MLNRQREKRTLLGSGADLRISSPGAYGVVNIIPSFSSQMPGFQGISAAYEAAAENPASYAWKTAKYDVAPKLLMYMAATGLMGSGLKKVMDRIPERE